MLVVIVYSVLVVIILYMCVSIFFSISQTSDLSLIILRRVQKSEFLF
jgi:hypothetical protein